MPLCFLCVIWLNKQDHGRGSDQNYGSEKTMPNKKKIKKIYSTQTYGSDAPHTVVILILNYMNYRRKTSFSKSANKPAMYCANLNFFFGAFLHRLLSIVSYMHIHD